MKAPISQAQSALLVQEGCRALKSLCDDSKEGLMRMYNAHICEIVLEIIKGGGIYNVSSRFTSSLLPSSSSSAVQWAWYLVTHLCQEEDNDDDDDKVDNNGGKTWKEPY
jgi:hypothetical protein